MSSGYGAAGPGPVLDFIQRFFDILQSRGDFLRVCWRRSCARAVGSFRRGSGLGRRIARGISFQSGPGLRIKRFLNFSATEVLLGTALRGPFRECLLHVLFFRECPNSCAVTRITDAPKARVRPVLVVCLKESLELPQRRAPDRLIRLVLARFDSFLGRCRPRASRSTGASNGVDSSSDERDTDEDDIVLHPSEDILSPPLDRSRRLSAAI